MIARTILVLVLCAPILVWLILSVQGQKSSSSSPSVGGERAVSNSLKDSAVVEKDSRLAEDVPPTSPWEDNRTEESVPGNSKPAPRPTRYPLYSSYPPLCQTLRPQGSWPHSKSKEFSVVDEEVRCVYPALVALLTDARCMSGKVWLFLGNSHLRAVLVELLESFGIDTSKTLRHAEHRHKSHVFYVKEHFLTIRFAFASLVFDRTTFEASAWNNRSNSSPSSPPDVVVTNMGMWRLVFRDTPKEPFDDAARANLGALRKYIGKRMATTRVVVLNMHRVHGVGVSPFFPQWYYVLKYCATEERQEAYRTMLECAAAQELPRARMVDFYNMTNNGFAQKHVVRKDGNHYRFRSPVMSEMLRVVLYAICGTNFTEEQRLRPRREMCPMVKPQKHLSVCLCDSVPVGGQDVNCSRRDAQLLRSRSSASNEESQENNISKSS